MFFNPIPKTVANQRFLLIIKTKNNLKEVINMRLEDFLDQEKLGHQFLAVKEYEEVRDRDTNKLTAYRLDISIQDINSPFYFEMISVKVKTLEPTLPVESLKNAKTTPVELVNLNMGQFNGNLWFICTDVKPVKK